VGEVGYKAGARKVVNDKIRVMCRERREEKRGKFKSNLL
jgi:hypothetical protein